MEILLIVLLIVINAFFAMSEIALTACRKVRLQVLAKSGNKGAERALQLLENPTQFLSTVQVGITCIAVFNAIIGDSVLSKPATNFLKNLGVSGEVATVISTVIVVSVVTFLTVVLGELVPKRIGQLFPEKVACLTAKTMQRATLVTIPVVRFFEWCTGIILRLLGFHKQQDDLVTEAEISAHLEEGVDAGIIEKHEHQMVCNIFHLDNRSLTSIMVPRADIRWLHENMTVEECLLLVSQEGKLGGHSCYPVCRGSLDKVVGELHIARLLNADIRDDESIKAYITPIVFVPETLNCMELVRRFRMETTALVLVVDEYGHLQGLITPFDLLEAITGELKQENQEGPWTTLQSDGAWLLDGLMPVGESLTHLEIEKLPPMVNERFTTLGGYIMARCGHMPQQGEEVRIGDWRLIVKQLDGRRVDVVQAIRQKPTDEITDE